MILFERIFCAAVFFGASLLASGYARAAGISNASSCQVIRTYLDQSDDQGIAEFIAYTLGQFKVFDGTISNGPGHGIFDLLSAEQVNNTAAIASMWCSTHPESSVREAAMFAYEGAIQLGAAIASSR